MADILFCVDKQFNRAVLKAVELVFYRFLVYFFEAVAVFIIKLKLREIEETFKSPKGGKNVSFP